MVPFRLDQDSTSRFPTTWTLTLERTSDGGRGENICPRIRTFVTEEFTIVIILDNIDKKINWMELSAELLHSDMNYLLLRNAL